MFRRDQRREIRKSVPKVMAIGLLVFALGVVLSVLVFPSAPSSYTFFPVIYIGIVIFVFGVFMYVWVHLIGGNDYDDEQYADTGEETDEIRGTTIEPVLN